MQAKQVDIRMQGIYHFCPHCNSHMRVTYKSKFCPDCGNELSWDNVREYEEINLHSCYHEDTDNFCRYYRTSCNGSKDCYFINANHLLKMYAGRLTISEKRLILSKKEYCENMYLS